MNLRTVVSLHLPYKLVILLFSLCSLYAFMPSQVYADTIRQVNLVAFQKDHKNANFEGLFTGSLSALISSVEKDAHVMVALRTPKVKDRDIINVQSDVLRMTSENKLANSGLNCRFFFNDESDEDSLFFSISGVCDVLDSDAAGTHKKQFLVKRTMLSDPSKVFNVWTKFHEDKDLGLVFYVDID
ncbi:hypothetical protein [Ghiorsea bivora]|uniref:hypothetical protein n=1 Tax=Ghiorsea bivora TaxID=1485545 RepID=UPI0005700806|nr:hypothetical protein [Ghiorsea bivora]